VGLAARGVELVRMRGEVAKQVVRMGREPALRR
jgi:hypothetical protein